MSTTETLAEALARLQQALPAIPKTESATVRGEKGSYSYSYADLAAVSAKLLPVVGRFGFSFTARPAVTEQGRLVLLCELLHVSGESRIAEWPLPAGATPQALGSSISYGRRYCLCAMTGCAPEADDDDAQAAQAEATTPRRKAGGRTKPEDTPEADQPTTAVPPGLMKRLQASFTHAGIKDRAERLAKVAQIIGREVSSANDLSRVEASKVVDQLAIEAAAAAAAETQAQQTAAGDA